MTTSELVEKLKTLDPSGQMTVVTSMGDELYTVESTDVGISSLYKVNDRGLWTTYCPKPNCFPGPFSVICI